MKNERKALVLGGGGITGIGWELGILAGLADLGVDLSSADVVVGTSAGSVVGAQLTSGVPIQQLYEEQLRDPAGELAAGFGAKSKFSWVLANLLPGGDARARLRMGRLALAAKTVPEADRLAVIKSRLPVHTWPERPLLITAVDADTGEPRVFDRESGVSLVQAVAASCAVPMVWPPITIEGHRYMDGGVRSSANADLAQGYGRVVVLAPSPGGLRRSGRIDVQLAGLNAGHLLHSTIVSPDAAAKEAIGSNVLNPANRAGAARAGRAQAQAVRDAVAVVWGTPPA